jgi:hypothetical protein
MFIGTEILSFNDNLYQLIRRFRDRENLPISDMKEYYHSDTVLRRDGFLYFCRLIQEPQIIEDGQIEMELVETPQQEEAVGSETSTEGEVLSPTAD